MARVPVGAVVSAPGAADLRRLAPSYAAPSAPRPAQAGLDVSHWSAPICHNGNTQGASGVTTHGLLSTNRKRTHGPTRDQHGDRAPCSGSVRVRHRSIAPPGM